MKSILFAAMTVAASCAMKAILSSWFWRVVQVVPALLLLGIALLTCADVVLRYVFNAPIAGALELTEFAMAAVIFAALPLVTLRRENVVIDLLDGRIQASTAARMDAGALIVAAVCNGFLAWRLDALALSLRDVGETTAMLYRPVYPAAWFMAFLAAFNAIVCTAMFFARQSHPEGSNG
jgi:TRAP-type C4-dicarboxylate transport system permease small subunit